MNDRIPRWLRLLDVQPQPFRALVRTFLRLEMRSSHYGKATGTDHRAVVPPLYWVVGQFLTTSALLSLLLFARVDAWFFAFASLSSTMLLLFSALVVEFHEVALDPDDVDVVGHRPVFPRTYAVARLTALLFYVTLMTTATSIFPAIIGAAQRDAGPFFLPWFLASTLLASVSTTATVVLLFTALGAGSQLERARGALAWVQIIAIMIVFYGAQLLLRKADGGLEYFAAKPPEWVQSLPSAALADAVIGLSHTLAADALRGFGLALATTVVLAMLAIWQLTSAWKRVQASGHIWDRISVDGSRVGGTVIRPFLARITKSRGEAVAFWFTRTLLQRDRDVALRTWPAFGMTLAALALGALTQQLADPLTERGGTVVLSLALIGTLTGAAPAVVHNVRFGRDHAASWILTTSPRLSLAHCAAGARMALALKFFLPVLLLVFITLALAWRNPAHAAIEALIVAASVWAALAVAQASHPNALPFSQAFDRGSTLGSVGVECALASAAGMVVGGAQYALGPAPLRQLALLVAVVFASAFLVRSANRRIARNDGKAGEA